MYIVLPQEVDGLGQLLNKIDRSTWYRERLFMQKTLVKFALPKVKFDAIASLKEVLQHVSDGANSFCFRIF